MVSPFNICLLRKERRFLPTYLTYLYNQAHPWPQSRDEAKGRSHSASCLGRVAWCDETERKPLLETCTMTKLLLRVHGVASVWLAAQTCSCSASTSLRFGPTQGQVCYIVPPTSWRHLQSRACIKPPGRWQASPELYQRWSYVMATSCFLGRPLDG